MAPSLNQRLREGIAAAQAQEFERARALLEPVVKASPQDALAWFWLAVAAPSAEAAVPCLRQVLAIDATHGPARQALAKLLLTQAGAATTAGAREAARALAAEAAALTPAVAAPWLALAAVSGNRPERIEALRRALALDPQPAIRTRLRQALLFHAMLVANSDRATARTLFLETAALDPTDLRVWHALARLAETPAAALAVVRELHELAPALAAGRTFLKQALVADARALAAGEQPEAACGRWREAVALDAQDLEAWLGLAEATPDEAEAQQALEAAFAIDALDARVSCALDRRRGVPLDPAAFAPPPDAFARLEGAEDVFARVDPTPDPFAQFDLSIDPFAQFAPPPTPAPTVPVAPAPPAHVAPSPSISAPAAPVAALPLTPAPVAPPPPSTPIVPVAPPLAAASGNGGGRRTVMVVDDSPTIRKILGLTLERAGYRVVAEPDGESAVERLSQLVPDVILLDIAMPKLDGYEVCKRIRQDPRTARVPVVMLSGKDAFFDKVKGRMAGATEYLTKPFETPAVLAAVAAACQPVPEALHG